ncbi:MAG TPA: hypothetical protein VK337_04675 [Xanthobacteraceae bacterium]|nr:hypothetical protein [Xanthobacteraceae bacterium]
MSQPGINGARLSGAGRAIAATVLLGALLAGCSDVYFARRESIALGAGDAVAANQVEQMVDPWPPNSSNKNLTFNGERMQRAVECYRIDKVTQPVDLDPSTDAALPPPTGMCAGKMEQGSAQAAAGTALGGAAAATSTYK